MQTAEAQPRSADAYDAAAAVATAAGEVVSSDRETTTFAWQVQPSGDVTRFRACATATTCGDELRQVRSSDLVGVQAIGRARPQLASGGMGDEVDVVRLTVLRPLQTSRGGYVSPSRDAPPAFQRTTR